MHNIKTNFGKILVVIKDILGDEIIEKVIIYGGVQGPGFLI